MSSASNEVVSSFSLVMGEDTYASQTSQDATTARRLQSFIPSLSGDLEREPTYPSFGTTNLGGAVRGLMQFDWRNPTGTITPFYFAYANAKLWQYNVGANSWAQVTAVGVMNNFPSYAVYNNQLHLDDGTNAWLFDGNVWILEGFPIPPHPPVIESTSAGTLTISTNRYYWYTWADHTTTRFHESDSSPISLGTGPLTNQVIAVRQAPGRVSLTVGSPIILGTAGTNFTSEMLGMTLYAGSGGLNLGKIVLVSDATHITLDTAQSATSSNNQYIIVPTRATHWHLYASASENDQVGKLLAQIPVSGSSAVVYNDQSPFVGTANSLFNIDIDRPLRNDPPASIIGANVGVGIPIITTHKYRIWRRRVLTTNHFYFSANEEVEIGNPAESYPGQDINTLSDIVNEFSLPDNSASIRGIIPHGDSLYFGSERSVWPFYGETYTDFAFTQNRAFSVGFAGPWSNASTPFGLAFLSYDKKVYLYPTFYVSQNESTSSLVELGRPLRNKLAMIKDESYNVGVSRIVYYNYSKRNWLVLSYYDGTTDHTFVFDFGTQGWVELQQGFTDTAVFDFNGRKILVGGGRDGSLHIIDDVSGLFTPTGSFAAATFRPALMDFNNPEGRRIFRYIEYEVSNVNLRPAIRFWLDPADVDAPGQPTGTLNPVQMKIGANLYRAYAPSTVGTVCHRLLVEIALPADTNAGKLRSIKLVADPVSASQ